MDVMKGDEAAKIIRKTYKRVSIVFVTNENVPNKRELDVLHQISKPIQIDALNYVIQKHNEHLEKYKSKYIELMCRNKRYVVDITKIMYINMKKQ